MLERADGAAVPLGTKVLLIRTDKLEGVTRGTIRLILVLLAVVIPAAVAATGAIIRIKRKNR